MRNAEFGGPSTPPSEKLFVRRGSPDPAVRLTEGLQVTGRAGNRGEYCRLSEEGRVASFPIDHITPSARCNATEPAHLTLACVALPPAENWLCFPARFRLGSS